MPYADVVPMSKWKLVVFECGLIVPFSVAPVAETPVAGLVVEVAAWRLVTTPAAPVASRLLPLPWAQHPLVDAVPEVPPLTSAVPLAPPLATRAPVTSTLSPWTTMPPPEPPPEAPEPTAPLPPSAKITPLIVKEEPKSAMPPPPPPPFANPLPAPPLPPWSNGFRLP